MQEIVRKKVSVVGLRARLPAVARIVALTLLILGLLFIAGSYYVRRNRKPFRMVSGTPELSTQVTGVVEGIERRETKNDRLWILLKAARDVSYSDGHHELEDVYLEVYPADGEKPDRISARRSIVEANNSRFSFLGDVRFETHDGLQVRTEAITYDRGREVAETNDMVNFTRENVTGRARGAVVHARERQLELRSEVEITVLPEARAPDEAAVVALDAPARPVTIRSARATFDQHKLRLSFLGGATAEQEGDRFSAETLTGLLSEQKRLRQLEARSHAYLRKVSDGRSTEVNAADMDFHFDANQQIERAVALRDVRARSLDADAEMNLTSDQVEAHFAAPPQGGGRSVLKEMTTNGRAVVKLAAPKSRASDPRAAHKQLTADRIKLYWRPTGRDLARAEAEGNAELVVEPAQPTSASERKTLTAQRFDCEFYEADNLARLFTATGGTVRAVIEPLQPSAERGQKNLTSDKMVASFQQGTQDVERVDAEGQAKFNELDRHGQADAVSYTAADETVRLRGGEPVIWDSRARLKAVEIDSDLRQEISYARGRAATTYYSQAQTGGAAPFKEVKNPVFIASERAEFRHAANVAIYTGNARAWQDDNFVRAERLTLRGASRSMEAEGRVESALYQAKRREAGGRASVVPVFVTASRMTYADTDRLLRYEGNVDIKQGTERLTSGVADVHLLKDRNEVERTVAQQNVVVTQPGRRGLGDWGQYTAADETVILKGEPARVEDEEQGTSESRRMIVYLRERRVVSDDASANQQSTGRVRSTHRVKKQ